MFITSYIVYKKVRKRQFKFKVKVIGDRSERIYITERGNKI